MVNVGLTFLSARSDYVLIQNTTQYNYFKVQTSLTFYLILFQKLHIEKNTVVYMFLHIHKTLINEKRFFFHIVTSLKIHRSIYKI